MNEELQKIIKTSTFDVQNGKYVYVRAKSAPSLGDHFLITQDADEITVVTREENLYQLDVVEKNKDFYALIALNVSMPFYSVGFLATVSDAIVKQGMNILIVSTYSKDYILVREDFKDKTEAVLLELGFVKK